MTIENLNKMGFALATQQSLDYLKPLAGFNDKQSSNIDEDHVKTGIFVHKDNDRLFLIFEDEPDAKFILGLVVTRGMRNIVIVKLMLPSVSDIDFHEHIISEYVKKHIDDAL